MSYFSRQEMIAGWRQDTLGAARVLVYGRNWKGTFLVWALGSLGAQDVAWLGPAVPYTDAFVDFLAIEHAPGLGGAFFCYPFEPQGPAELDWILMEPRLSLIVAAGGPACPMLSAVAAARGIPFLAISGSVSGTARETDHPIPAMIAAALAADEFRQLVNPLPDLVDREFGAASVFSVAPHAPGPVVVVGVGGVGVYTAVLLAACGVTLALIDGDAVEPANLNRQGLFTADDANAGRAKSVAAAERLRRLFPGVRVSGWRAWVDDGSEALLREVAPSVIVSAVDNGASRLLLSGFGARLGTPVVQAGTDVFSADCFVQDPGGSSLDQQMRGALRAAAAAESIRRLGGCAVNPSYVVPGMLAGAFAAARVLALLGGGRDLPSLHWRSGVLPRGRREIRDEFAITME